jgi:hypothetical protein
MIRLAIAALATTVAVGVNHAAESGGFPDGTPDKLSIRVVNDLNGDGKSQDDEPGIANYEVYGGCSDAISVFTTDADGYVLTEAGTMFHENCFYTRRGFGWLPTTPLEVTIPHEYEGAFELEFLLQDLGDDVMEISGEAIIDGLPAVDLEFAHEAPPFDGDCIESFHAAYESRTNAVVIVVGGDQRSDCPENGDEFTLISKGQDVLTMTFAEGGKPSADFVIGGDSLRLYVSGVDGAAVYEGGQRTGGDCAVIFELGGYNVYDLERVFVLPDDVRAGCGAPSRDVQFYHEGLAMYPTVPWVAGELDPAPDLRTTRFGSIGAPDVGTGARASESPLPAVAGAIGATGLMFAVAGAAFRRPCRSPRAGGCGGAAASRARGRALAKCERGGV